MHMQKKLGFTSDLRSFHRIPLIFTGKLIHRIYSKSLKETKQKKIVFNFVCAR